MYTFTQAYKAARKSFSSEIFSKGDDDWDTYLKTDLGVMSLLADSGPDPKFAASADKLRGRISGDRGKFIKRLFKGEGDVILEAAKGDGKTGSAANRAGAIKFVRHLYRQSKRGGQDVWVYNPVASYGDLIFDELKGSSSKMKRTLNKTKEIFKPEEMKYMSDALKIALAASQKAMAKVNAGDDDTKQLVRDWFCADHASDDELEEAMKVLKAGLPKIVNGCNSNSLVFTDYVNWRKERGSIYGGAIRGGEGGGFPVIYIEGSFTRMTGNSGKLWLAALTIVHEMSHYMLSTEDHRYDFKGLKPKSNSLPAAKARTNADSWGYFVMDADGKLSKADKLKTLV